MLMFLNRESTKYHVIFYLIFILLLDICHVWHGGKLKIPQEEIFEKLEIQRKIKKKNLLALDYTIWKE